jgi:hypothetical protein
MKQPFPTVALVNPGSWPRRADDHNRSSQKKSVMGVFSLSDIIITVTLLINATALMASKVHPEPRSVKSDDAEGLDNTGGSRTDVSMLSKFYIFLNTMRRLSCLIVVWNIFFIILMLFVFRS